MKEEIDHNDELKQLLDALEEHGCNAKRQQQLSELIDRLEVSGTSLRGGTTKQSRHEATSQSVTSTSDKTSSMDCFVPRKCSAFDGVNDAKRSRERKQQVPEEIPQRGGSHGKHLAQVEVPL